MPCGHTPSGVARDALSPDKKACLVSDISEEARLRARTEISRTGTQSVENTPCAATFRASLLKITSFLLKPKMRLRANPVVGGFGLRRDGVIAPYRNSRPISKINCRLRNEPRGLYRKRHAYYTKIRVACGRLTSEISGRCCVAERRNPLSV